MPVIDCPFRTGPFDCKKLKTETDAVLGIFMLSPAGGKKEIPLGFCIWDGYIFPPFGEPQYRIGQDPAG